jgi:hypothetical protein
VIGNHLRAGRADPDYLHLFGGIHEWQLIGRRPFATRWFRSW